MCSLAGVDPFDTWADASGLPPVDSGVPRLTYMARLTYLHRSTYLRSTTYYIDRLTYLHVVRLTNLHSAANTLIARLTCDLLRWRSRRLADDLRHELDIGADLVHNRPPSDRIRPVSQSVVRSPYRGAWAIVSGGFTSSTVTSHTSSPFHYQSRRVITIQSHQAKGSSCEAERLWTGRRGAAHRTRMRRLRTTRSKRTRSHAR